MRMPRKTRRQLVGKQEDIERAEREQALRRLWWELKHLPVGLNLLSTPAEEKGRVAGATVPKVLSISPALCRPPFCL
jgi:hypothetical protein